MFMTVILVSRLCFTENFSSRMRSSSVNDPKSMTPNSGLQSVDLIEHACIYVVYVDELLTFLNLFIICI